MENLKTALKSYISKNEGSREENETAEVSEFLSLCSGGSGGLGLPPVSALPPLLGRLPGRGQPLAWHLREDARALLLQARGRALLDNLQLKRLWALLQGGAEVGGGALELQDQLLTYTDYRRIADDADEDFKPYLSVEVFAKLQVSSVVSVLSLFNYVMRRMWLGQTRIGLAMYDSTGCGYLREHDLEQYILELVPTLAALDGLDASFASFYVCTASRKFLFFLDPLRTGRVRISDILASGFLDDMLELRDEELPKEVQEKNWFSAPSALRVYGQYLNLDRDHNGMLSLDELQGYGSGTLTRVFLQRVFQQCLTYDGEMDYKTYLDLVLALEYRREPQSLHYLFRVLDIHGKGYLDGFTLNYFFKAIQEQMLLHGAEAVNFEDVKDEIFDMVRPAQPSRITLADLTASGHGGTAISILIEFQCFLAYEHRENLVADSPDSRL